MATAIAALESSSVAQGMISCDAMVKTADVDLIECSMVSPGKYWIVIGGEIAPVRAALRRGIELAADTVLDSLLIPQLHPDVIPALRGTAALRPDDALGVIETQTAAAAIVAADRSAKTSDVRLTDIRLANGLGGKGVVTLSGSVSEVEAAVAEGRSEALRKGLLIRSVVIPRLHPQLRARWLR